jgi:CRISPR-associated protein Cas1
MSNTDNSSVRIHNINEWKLSKKRIVYILGKYNIEIKTKTMRIFRNSKEIVVKIDEIDRLIIIGKPHFNQDLYYTFINKGINIEFYDYFSHSKGIFYSNKRQEDKTIFVNAQGIFDANKDARLKLANLCIEAKIKNYVSILKRRNINIPSQMLIKSPLQIDEFDKLMGVEGIAAKAYFQELASIVEPFKFEGRKARPAPDPINLMLSFGYSLIYNRFGQSLLNAGLNPKIGFFHVGRGSHWALASDLMEDLRFVVDRFVIKLVKQSRVKPEDFKKAGQQCVFATREAFLLFVTEFEEIMNHVFSAPQQRPGYNKGDEICFNQWIDATAKGYAAFISNNERFIPFIANY